MIVTNPEAFPIPQNREVYYGEFAGRQEDEAVVMEEVDQAFIPKELGSLSTTSSPTIEELLSTGSLTKLCSLSIQYLLSRCEHRLPMENYLSLFHELSSKSGGVFFDDLEKANFIKSVIILTTHSANRGCEKALLNWARALKENFHGEIFSLVFNPDSFSPGDTVEKLISVLQGFMELFPGDEESVFENLLDFFDSRISLDDLIEEFERKKNEAFLRKFPEKDLSTVQREFSTVNPISVQFPLSSPEISRIFQEYSAIALFGKEYQLKSIEEIVERALTIKERYSSKQAMPNDYLEILAIGREALRRKFGINPYNTQILVVLGLLQSRNIEELKGRIAQVKTGEGKSTITTLLAFCLAIQGRKVDIVSSSEDLALRDQKKYASFFSDFGILTSNICSAVHSEEQFAGQIIYGTNYNFEFALLRELFFESRVRQNRPYDCVIVDESDNLFIDIAQSSARIAIPSDRNCAWVYPIILEFIKKYSSQIPSQVQRCLPLLKEELNSFLENRSLEGQIEQFSDKQLRKWMISAHNAFYVFQEDQDYIIQERRIRGEAKRLEKKVCIIDRKNTGRCKENSRWPNGIHEFLEVKHSLPVEKESFVPASIAHPTFFRQYNTCFGMTGTAGDLDQRKEIFETFNVDSFDVPPHTPCQRTEEEPLLLESMTAFYEALREEIRSKQEERRPILLFFETIKDLNEFSTFIQQEGIYHQTLNEKQEAKEDVVISRAGEPAMVTLATSVAGRGTDIILHFKSLQFGGLHVVFTFFPESDRVENQGLGRAGRQGQFGSSRLILSSHDPIVSQALQSNPLFLKLPRKEQFEYLGLLRSMKAQALSQRRILRAQQEEVDFEYLTQFSSRLQFWGETLNEEYLSFISQKLAAQSSQNSQVNQEDFIFSRREQLFQQQITMHAQDFYVNAKRRIEIIKQAKALIREQMLTFWSKEFFEVLDDVKTEEGSESLNSYVERVQKLFQQKRDLWEFLLENPGESFSHYLERLIVGAMQ